MKGEDKTKKLPKPESIIRRSCFILKISIISSHS